jgi:WD40 repeat protein
MRITELATSWNGWTIAAGQPDGIVHIWDVCKKKSVSTLDTIHDFGGRRLAVTADGRHCVAGAFDVEGIASYSCADGAVAWCRKDLKQVQRIQISLDDRRVYCCFEQGPCHVLNPDTGKTITTWRGVRGIWESPYEQLLLLEKQSLEVQTREGQKVVAIPRVTFGVLSIAFAPGRICISESGGPVRCIDTSSGRELWRYSLVDQHFLELAYVDEAKTFVGICWPYEHGGAHTLQRFTIESGDFSVIAELGPFGEFAFCGRGSLLIETDGSVRDVLSGRVEMRFSFPT